MTSGMASRLCGLSGTRRTQGEPVLEPVRATVGASLIAAPESVGKFRSRSLRAFRNLRRGGLDRHGRLQVRRVAGLPGCRVAGLPGCRVAGLPGCRVAGLPGCRVAGLPGCRVAGLPGCRVAGLPGCRVAGLPGCRVAGLPGCRVAGLPGCRVAGLPHLRAQVGASSAPHDGGGSSGLHPPRLSLPSSPAGASTPADSLFLPTVSIFLPPGTGRLSIMPPAVCRAA